MMNPIHGKTRRSFFPPREELCFYRGAEAPSFDPYDYAERPPQRAPRSAGKSQRTVAPSKKGSHLWVYVMLFGLAVAFCGTLIVVQSERITAANRKNSVLTDEIAALRDRYVEKQTTFEKVTDIEYIRQHASEDLGMANPKPDQLISLDIDAPAKTAPSGNEARAEAQSFQVVEQPLEPEKPKMSRPFRSLLKPERRAIDVEVGAADGD